MHFVCCNIPCIESIDDVDPNAWSNVTSILVTLMQAIDDDTVMLIVGDHGYVPVPVSVPECIDWLSVRLKNGRHEDGEQEPEIRYVPLFIYKNNSNFRAVPVPVVQPFPSILSSDEAGEEIVYSNECVAPTAAALLGVPVPRQSESTFLPEILSLLQLPDISLPFKVSSCCDMFDRCW